MDIWMDVDAALAEVPVNVMPLIDNTDFKTIEADVNYNATGLTLIWHFVTTAGAYTQTAVTPTDTGGAYDWVEQGNGLFTIEIPASGGASINNDTEGFGWFTGVATGILPWRGPVIGFRAAGLNDKLIDSAYSTTRGLAGTAVPDAAADGPLGLPVSDAGGLDLDAQIGTKINAIQTIFSGITSLAQWLGLMAGKQVGDATARAEIRATGAGSGTFDETTDSGEALRDNMGTAGASLAPSAAAANKIADHVRRRTQTNVEASGDGDALSVGSEYGLIQQAQESNTTANAGKLTVFKTDGTTELAQKDIATDAAAEPVTGVS